MFYKKKLRGATSLAAVALFSAIIRIAICLTIAKKCPPPARLNFCVDMVKWPLEKSGRLLSGNYH